MSDLPQPIYHPDDAVWNADASADEIKSIAAAVITQAFNDAFGALVSCGGHVSREAERMEAILFLTATDGAWEESRVTLCDIVGVLPDAVRERAARLLAERAQRPPDPVARERMAA